MVYEDGQQPPSMVKNVIAALALPAMVIDSSARVTYSNAAAESLLAELSGGAWTGLEPVPAALGELRDMLWGDVLPEAESPWQRLARGDRVRDLTLVASGGPAGARMLRFGGQPLGSGDLAVLTIADVTGEHHGEAFFEAAFRKGPQPMSITRVSDKVVLDVNDALLDLLGRQRSEIVGSSIGELLAIQPAYREQWQHQGSEWNTGLHEVVVKDVAREPLVLLASSRPLQYGGSPGLLAIYQDVTEQRATERRVREATQVVMRQAAEFSRTVVQQLERLRGPGRTTSSYIEINLLTKRERDVVTRVGAGHSNSRIAKELSLTPQTVRNYVTRIYQKIGVSNRAEAVVWARERGLVEG